ncbi:MAG TPA: ZIP family metal transporter [Patescibacteria group bacterium]|nr:ZIP family metal transporter [Patescibacteria group bacterium]
MLSIWLYTIISVFIVSLISLIGVFTLSIDQKKLYNFLIYFVSLSAGTLMGDAFIHLIPEAYKSENNRSVSVYILLGILIFFVLEKILHWRHCHEEPCPEHPHPFSYVILVGDAVHNAIDGMVIAASFFVSIPIGIATATAVIFHEIPHEIGNFGSLVYGGFTRRKALMYNFLSALFAIAGAVLVLVVNITDGSLTKFLIPFAAGGFVYIAGTDLIPELHKHTEIKKGIWQLLAFIFGIGLMLGLLISE